MKEYTVYVVICGKQYGIEPKGIGTQDIGYATRYAVYYNTYFCKPYSVRISNRIIYDNNNERYSD